MAPKIWCLISEGGGREGGKVGWMPCCRLLLKYLPTYRRLAVEQRKLAVRSGTVCEVDPAFVNGDVRARADM